MRRSLRLFVAGIPVVAMICVGSWKFTHLNQKENVHRIQKRQSDGSFSFNVGSVSDEKDDGITINVFKDKDSDDFEEHLPGYLVCKKRKATDNPLVRVKSELEELPDTLNDISLRDELKKAPVVRHSLSSLSPKRPIGCCPPGYREGQIYRVGSSCCIDAVYNTTSHFCCLIKKRVLLMTDDNLDFCYPKDGIPYCREMDLKMNEKLPMMSECRNNDMGKPISCQFTCPSGTQPKDGVTDVRCKERGIWSRTPTCCEGCPDTLRLDLWFLVEVTQNYGKENLRHILKLLKDLLSYMPVSQNRVRVGITIFNRVVFYDIGTWYLNEHDSHGSINAAIEEIPMEGTGVKTGDAISWVANNAFTKSKGNREDVENLVVAILHGTPEDPFVEPARELKAISKVITIGIGDQITDDDLAAVASLPKNMHRSSSFDTLPELNKVLFKSVCGEQCILHKEQ